MDQRDLRPHSMTSMSSLGRCTGEKALTLLQKRLREDYRYAEWMNCWDFNRDCSDELVSLTVSYLSVGPSCSSNAYKFSLGHQP